MLPANLSLQSVVLSPAILPGGAPFWLIYRRLDEGALCHVQYVGLTPQVEGESAAELVERVIRSWPDLKE
jgi:hypothetical protein